jgi:hypothetical protein
MPKNSGEGIVRRKDTSSLDALRKQLLGRNATKPGALQKLQSLPKPMPKPMPKPVNLVPSDSEEDEGGKAAAFVSRKKPSKSKAASAPKSEDDTKTDLENKDSQEAARPIANPAAQKSTPSKRKASSFLDEMLAEKAKKKSKRRRAIKLPNQGDR